MSLNEQKLLTDYKSSIWENISSYHWGSTVILQMYDFYPSPYLIMFN